MENALYDFIHSLRSIRKLTRSLRSLVRFLILLNSWIKIVRAHFPWSNLYFYDCPFPPSKAFPSKPSCKKYSALISETLLQRIEVGAVLVYSQLGNVDSVHCASLYSGTLAAPFVPRCQPLSLDKLIDVTRNAYKGSFLMKCARADKSGYDHILLTEGSRNSFAMEWEAGG